jgi:hypothetical protein
MDSAIRVLAELEFAIACFGHADPLTDGAGASFREWSAEAICLSRPGPDRSGRKPRLSALRPCAIRKHDSCGPAGS